MGVRKASGTVPAHGRWSRNISCGCGSLLSSSDWAGQLSQGVLPPGQRLGVLFATSSRPHLELSALKPCHLSLQVAARMDPSSWPLQPAPSSSPACDCCPAALTCSLKIHLHLPTFQGPHSVPLLFYSLLLQPDNPPFNN